MSKLILVLSLLIATSVLASTDSSTTIAEGEIVKPLTPTQKYGLHVQCAQLATIAGEPDLSTTHMNTAKEIKPDNIPMFDMLYRAGYVDGFLESQYQLYKGAHSIQKLALESYKVTCPSQA